MARLGVLWLGFNTCPFVALLLGSLLFSFLASVISEMIFLICPMITEFHAHFAGQAKGTLGGEEEGHGHRHRSTGGETPLPEADNSNAGFVDRLFSRMRRAFPFLH